MSTRIGMRIVIVTVLLLAAGHLIAGESGAEPIPFESYSLVILMRGPLADEIPKAELADIQTRHIAHLTAMAESGKLLIAGPFSAQQDEAYRGLCIYRTSVDEARRLAEGDPAVKAGRLSVQVMTWHVEKGYLAFPKAK